MIEALEWWEGPARLLVAVLSGMLIGFEREVKDKPAGLRTHALVALGAAAFMLAGLELGYAATRDGTYTVDPTRTLAGIVGGVGFLGAGVIAFTGERVKGLTTAASIWLVAAVGTVTALGQFRTAGVTVLLALVVLHLLHRFERRTLDTKKEDDERK